MGLLLYIIIKRKGNYVNKYPQKNRKMEQFFLLFAVFVLLIVSLVHSVVDLTKSCREGRFFSVRGQVRDTAKFRHAEIGDSLLPFLGIEYRDRRGGGAGSVPEEHGRNIQKSAEQHAFEPEMAEKRDRVLV